MTSLVTESLENRLARLWRDCFVRERSHSAYAQREREREREQTRSVRHPDFWQDSTKIDNQEKF